MDESINNKELNKGSSDTNTSKHKKLKKILIRVLLGLVSFIFIIIITGFLIVYFNQDKIKRIFVEELNKSLRTEITVKDIEFSVFAKFPNASLRFKDVLAKDAITSPHKDTLLSAKSIYLEFNLWDIYYKNYKIKKIEINNGKLNLRIDKEGNDNYHFWKPSNDTVQSNFKFVLKKIAFNNVSIRYLNVASEQYYDIKAVKTIAQGDFSNEIQSLNLSGDLMITHFQSGSIVYLRNEKSKLVIKGNINTTKHTIDIEKGELKLNNLAFDVSGNISYADNYKFLNLKIKGKDLKLHDFIQELPEDYRKYLDKYKSKGDFDINLTLKGKYDGSNIPLASASFNFRNGEIYHSDTDAKLTNVNFEGTYTNAESLDPANHSISLKNISCTLNGGMIKGNVEITDLINPYLILNAQANIKLEDMHSFIKSEKVQALSGGLILDLNFKGKLANGTLKAEDFIKSNSSGTASISNFNLQLKDDIRKFTNVYGSFSFTNNDVKINDLSGKIASSDFKINGYFRNILPFLFIKDQKLQVIANVNSNTINLDELLYTKTSASSNGEFKMSNNYEFLFNLDVKNIKFKKFNARYVSSNVTYKDNILYANSINMESMGGVIKGMMQIDGTKQNSFLITVDVSAKKINAQQMFYVFDNFGQNNLTDKNIIGNVSADIQFASIFDQYLTINKKSVRSKINLTIENGRLVNYQPMMKLSRFIKEEDLKDISFSTLQNQIIIQDEVIKIPAMEIKTSAINLNLAGEHKFDNHINYRINLLLSEITSRKRKQREKAEPKTWIEEDDGLGRTKIYIKVTGTIDNPEFSYDTKSVIIKVGAFLKEGGENFIKTIKDEFKWLKKDSATIKQQQRLKEQEKGKFIYEWDEDKTETPKTEVKPKALPPSNLIIKPDDD